MVKKFLILSTLVLSLIFFSIHAGATPSATLAGQTFAVDGTMKLTLKIVADGKSFFDTTINFSDLAAMGETFTFNGDRSFQDGFGLLAGQWTQNGTKFTVDLFIEEFLGALSEMGIFAEETSGSFTGSIQRSGDIKGKFNVVLDIYGEATSELASTGLDGSSLKLSGSYVGYADYVTNGLVVSHARTFAGQNRAKSKAIAKSLADTIKAKALEIRPR